MNDGFDVLNSKIPVDTLNPLKSGYGMNLTRQNQALESLEILISNIRFYTKGNNAKKVKNVKTALFPCQKGFILSIKSFRALHQDLKLRYGTHYLLGIRTTQDFLESYFSMVRAFGGSNSTPSPIEFKYRMRLLILGSKIRRSKGTNCEYEEDLNYLASDIIHKLELPKRTPRCIPASSAPPAAYESASEHQDFSSERESLRYLAGYLAWKLNRKRMPGFGTITAALTLPQGAATWITHLSCGGLMMPSDPTFETTLNCESVFLEVMRSRQFHASISSICSDAIFAKFPTANPSLVKEFVNCRLRIRVRELNSNKISQINEKKSKQFAAGGKNSKKAQ